MELTRDHFVVLLNALARTETRTLTIKHPSEEIGTLLEIQLDEDSPSASVSIRVQPDDYESARDEIRLDYGDRPYNDLPDAHALVMALTASGLIEFRNQSAIDRFIDEVCYPAVEAGEPPVMLGIDANIFPFEYPGVLGIDHLTGSTDDKDRHPTNGYAISNGVVDELDWQFDHYSVDSLVEAFGDEFERFDGQPGGSNRIGKLGHQVYQYLIATRNVDIVESERGDDNIIDGYVRYDETHRKRPVLLSNDSGFVETAIERGLRAQQLTFQNHLPRRTTATWDEIAEVLYYLTTIFGVIRLPKVTLFGVWEDKQDQHWQSRTIDIDYRGTGTGLRSHVIRHRHLARSFDEIL